MSETKKERLARLCEIWGTEVGRIMPDGSIVLIVPFAYTTSIMVGVDEMGYRCRYCYEKIGEALDALIHWNGFGDPGGPWIKAKGSGRDELNPALFNQETGGQHADSGR